MAHVLGTTRGAQWLAGQWWLWPVSFLPEEPQLLSPAWEGGVLGSRPQGPGLCSLCGPLLTLLHPCAEPLPRPPRWPLLSATRPQEAGARAQARRRGCACTPQGPQRPRSVLQELVPLCYRCSTKMRVLCEQRYCAVCREELRQVSRAGWPRVGTPGRARPGGTTGHPAAGKGLCLPGVRPQAWWRRFPNGRPGAAACRRRDPHRWSSCWPSGRGRQAVVEVPVGPEPAGFPADP